MKLFATTLLLATTITGSGITDSPIEPTPEVQVEEQVQPVKLKWVGKGFSKNESRTLEFLQEQGITDRMALAVIMGNIKQESKFYPNICEGGARVNYSNCHRGGYGLIQWTTTGRFYGLGNHAKQIGGNPSTLETQLSYMVTEVEWERAKEMFVIPDRNLKYYMKAADIWLGWGIYGNRGYYSQQYFDCLTLG